MAAISKLMNMGLLSVFNGGGGKMSGMSMLGGPSDADDETAGDTSPLGDDWGGNLLRKFPYAVTPGGSGRPFRDDIEKKAPGTEDRNILDPYWLHHRLPLNEAADTMNKIRRVK
jgi:hypothetical protein